MEKIETTRVIDEVFSKPPRTTNAVPTYTGQFGVAVVPTGQGRVYDRRRLDRSQRHELAPLTTQLRQWGAFVGQHVNTWRARSALVDDVRNQLNALCAEIAAYLIETKTRQGGCLYFVERKPPALLSDEVLHHLVVSGLKQQFDGNEQLRKAFVNRRRNRSMKNVLHIFTLLDHAAAPSQWSPVREEVFRVLHHLVDDLGIYLPIGVGRANSLTKLYKPGNNFSVISSLLLLHCGVAARWPLRKSHLRIVDVLTYAAIRGLYDFSVISHCSLDLNFLSSSLTETNNAVYRAASGRFRIKEGQMIETYLTMYKELKEGESIEINFSDSQGFDSDCIVSLANDFQNREFSGVGPHYGRGGAALSTGENDLAFIRLNVFPFFSATGNFRKSTDGSVIMQKCGSNAEDAPMKFTVRSKRGLECSFGWKFIWNCGFLWNAFFNATGVQIFNHDHILMKRKGHERTYEMSFDIKQPEFLIKKLFSGELSLSKLLLSDVKRLEGAGRRFLGYNANIHPSLLDGPVFNAHKRADAAKSSWVWDRGFYFGNIHVYGPQMRIHPKYAIGFILRKRTTWAEAHENVVVAVIQGNKRAEIEDEENGGTAAALRNKFALSRARQHTFSAGSPINLMETNPEYSDGSAALPITRRQIPQPRPAVEFGHEASLRKTTQDSKIHGFCSDFQGDFAYQLRSVIPGDWMSPVRHGGAIRYVAPLFARIYEHFDSAKSRSKVISVKGHSRLSVGCLPDVKISYTIEPSLKSGKLPLDEFDLSILVQEPAIAKWLKRNNKNCNQLCVICGVSQRDLKRSCENGSLDIDLLDRLTEKHKAFLPIEQIAVEREKQTSSQNHASAADQQDEADSSSESSENGLISRPEGTKEYASRIVWGCNGYVMLQRTAALVKRHPLKYLNLFYKPNRELERFEIQDPDVQQ